jgi:hypothetical protein
VLLLLEAVAALVKSGREPRTMRWIVRALLTQNLEARAGRAAIGAASATHVLWVRAHAWLSTRQPARPFHSVDDASTARVFGTRPLLAPSTELLATAAMLWSHH